MNIIPIPICKLWNSRNIPIPICIEVGFANLFQFLFAGKLTISWSLVPDIEKKWYEKKQSPSIFFKAEKKQVKEILFLNHFFRLVKIICSLLSVSEICQHQGSGNLFRGAKGNLFWSCHILIPVKCWRWRNLTNHPPPTPPALLQKFHKT